MANHEIQDPRVFNLDLRKIEVTDPVHADVVNPLFDILLNNDAYLAEDLVNKIAELVGSSPEELNTLEKIATALNNKPNAYNDLVTYIDTKIEDLAGAGRTTETLKGVSDNLNTLLNNFNKLTIDVKQMKVVDTSPTPASMLEGVLYLVKEGGN